MKKFAFVLALSFVVAGAALAANPSLMAGGQSGTHNIVRSGRDVCWSEPADLEGMIASSEVIGVYALETEIANDFYFVTADNTVNLARWWGGYWNNYGCGDIGYATNWNLRFYNDGGCIPWTHGCRVPGRLRERDVRLLPGRCLSGLPVLASVSVPVTAKRRSTGSARRLPTTPSRRSAAVSPPAWSPLATPCSRAPILPIRTGRRPSTCSVWRSTPARSSSAGIVPTNNTTWGAIKGLYR